MPKFHLEKLPEAVRQLVGSRFFVALSALSFVAFLSHAVFAPERFPPMAPLSPALWGLAPAPPPVSEFVELQPGIQQAAGEKAREALAAGIPYAPGAAQWLYTALANAAFGGDFGRTTRFLNYIALGAWSALLWWSIYLLARRGKEGLQ
jgi:hypothetical protein